MVERLAAGRSSYLSALLMTVLGDTDVDAPRYFGDARWGAGARPVAMLIARLRVVGRTACAVDANSLAPVHRSEDVRALSNTPNSQLWGSPQYHRDFPGVTESGARQRVDHGATVLSVDDLSVRALTTPRALAYPVPFGAASIGVEGLERRDVELGASDRDYLAQRIGGSDGAPARAVPRKG